MTRHRDQSLRPQPPPPRGFAPRDGAGALIAVLVAGAALGAGGTGSRTCQPQSVMLLQPAPIDKMSDATAVASRARSPRSSATSSSCRTERPRAGRYRPARRRPARRQGRSGHRAGPFRSRHRSRRVIVHADGRTSVRPAEAATHGSRPAGSAPSQACRRRFRSRPRPAAAPARGSRTSAPAACRCNAWTGARRSAAAPAA